MGHTRADTGAIGTDETGTGTGEHPHTAGPGRARPAGNGTKQAPESRSHHGLLPGTGCTFWPARVSRQPHRVTAELPVVSQ